MAGIKNISEKVITKNSTGSKDKKVLVLVGPTGSGKSDVGILIAQKIKGEIVSADSRQVYKYLDIGTAKPSEKDLKKCKHHFINELLPDQDFNAGDYGKHGRERLNKILQAGKHPIIVGGSGLYVQSLIDGFFDGPSSDDEIRNELYKQLNEKGAEALLNDLQKVDPISAVKMLPSNTRRIIRALEVYKLTGTPISELHKEKITIDFRPIIVGLEWGRKILYERINKRVDLMLNQGLLSEVKSLIEKGYSKRINSLQTVGYQEVFDFFEGEIEFEQMVELIKRNSRRYAKRQMTWFRRDERIKWFTINSENEYPDISDKIIEHFKNN